jgi:DNA-binding PadR family transcriptional regulator
LIEESNPLPLTETVFLILLSMSAQPQHGYAILKEVAKLSDGRINLSTGTLYGALARLLAQGWIERVDDDAHDEPVRARKQYRLTPSGRRILRSEVERMKHLVSVASLRKVEE